MKTLGIIGTGSFGNFAKEKLSDYFEIVTFDVDDPVEKLAKVAQAEYIMLAIPLSAYEAVLESLKPLISKDAVIIDICSVKIIPIQRIKKFLPQHQLLATHPLFGPQSATDSLAGHKIILCDTDQTTIGLVQLAKSFFESIGLTVVQQTASQHDELMADIHALTFFIAKGLVAYGVEKKDLITPSYQKLLDLADHETHHSQDLFATIQKGNPYARNARHKIRSILDEIDDSLNSH